MLETLIKVEGLYKKFTRSLKRSMYYGTIDSLRTMVGLPYDEFNLRKAEFWALQDINLELKKGETLGIVGLNGSGKSTLLRLLSGVFPPDAGRIEIHGRIGSLIAVGVGFHPHMSGRENIYLNGTILGMDKEEINKKFEEIVDFAEIHESLDAPVATYSSGMKVRLGFSIAIHCEPEIMLIDEVLSVGDIGFRNKSLQKIYEFKQKANGVIFISHDLEQVKNLCDRIVVLEGGKIVYEGDVYKGLVYYEDDVRDKKIRFEEKLKRTQIQKQFKYGFKESAGDIIDFKDFGILNRDSAPTNHIGVHEPLNYYCDFDLKKPIKSLFFSVGILDEKCKPLIWVMNNDGSKEKFENLKPDSYRLIVQFPEHHLVPNVYIPSIAIRNGETGETYERAWAQSSFHVRAEGTDLSRGIISVKENWLLYPKAINADSNEVFENIKPGDITIDCGANVGDVTQKMSEKGAKVFAFEPNPFAFKELEKRFRNNKNVVCINKGVLDKNDKLPLYFHYESKKDPVKYSVSSSIIASKRNVDEQDYVEVELIDLHEFIMSINDHIKILKLDVEGAEVEILNKLIDLKSINKNRTSFS